MEVLRVQSLLIDDVLITPVIKVNGYFLWQGFIGTGSIGSQMTYRRTRLPAPLSLLLQGRLGLYTVSQSAVVHRIVRKTMPRSGRKVRAAQQCTLANCSWFNAEVSLLDNPEHHTGGDLSVLGSIVLSSTTWDVVVRCLYDNTVVPCVKTFWYCAAVSNQFYLW